MPPTRPWWRDIEVVFALCLLIATTIYLAATFQISTAFDAGFVNSAFTPRVVAILMYMALAVVLRDALRSQAQEREDSQAPASGWADPAKVVVLTAIYVAVFRSFGYVLSTLVYVSLLFYVFRFEEKSPMKRILYAVGITAVFYLLFAEIFNVRLPMAGGVL